MHHCTHFFDNLIKMSNNVDIHYIQFVKIIRDKCILKLMFCWFVTLFVTCYCYFYHLCNFDFMLIHVMSHFHFKHNILKIHLFNCLVNNQWPPSEISIIICIYLTASPNKISYWYLLTVMYHKIKYDLDTLILVAQMYFLN